MLFQGVTEVKMVNKSTAQETMAKRRLKAKRDEWLTDWWIDSWNVWDAHYCKKLQGEWERMGSSATDSCHPQTISVFFRTRHWWGGKAIQTYMQYYSPWMMMSFCVVLWLQFHGSLKLTAKLKARRTVSTRCLKWKLEICITIACVVPDSSETF